MLDGILGNSHIPAPAEAKGPRRNRRGGRPARSAFGPAGPGLRGGPSLKRGPLNRIQGPNKGYI